MDCKGGGIMTNNHEQEHKPRKTRVFKQIGIALSIVATIAVISVNGYLLFNEESSFEKSYFINESRRVYADHHVSSIKKDVILAAEEEVHISADAKALSQIVVRAGQSISLNEELASFNSDQIDNEQRKLEIERDAYEKELSTLESVLKTLENDKKSKAPLTKIDSKQIDEDLNVTVQTEIAQSTPTEAIALVEQKIAEVERQLEIAQNRLAELNTSLSLTSPVDGIVADVKEENGTVTFILYSNEKNLVTYITEEEWKEIEEGQRVEIENIEDQFLRDEMKVEDDEDEAPIEGSVMEKQKIPATNSIWLDEMKNKLPDSKLFEVRISPFNQFVETPFTTFTKATIITNESLSAYKVNEHWVMDVKKKVDEEEAVEGDESEESDEGFSSIDFLNNMSGDQSNEDGENGEDQYTIEHYVYILGDDGTVRLAQVFIDFTDDGKAIITGEIEDGVVILNDKQKEEASRTFLPASLKLPKKEVLKTFTWEDYVRYLVY